MAKKLFALVAPGGRGKSETLIMLGNMLAPPPHRNVVCIYPNRYRGGKDIAVTFMYNGQCIGILSDSDYDNPNFNIATNATNVTNATDALVHLVRGNNCDVIFCAAHPETAQLAYPTVANIAIRNGYTPYGIRHDKANATQVATYITARANALKDLL